jgi:hypothetical protein
MSSSSSSSSRSSSSSSRRSPRRTTGRSPRRTEKPTKHGELKKVVKEEIKSILPVVDQAFVRQKVVEYYGQGLLEVIRSNYMYYTERVPVNIGSKTVMKDHRILVLRIYVPLVSDRTLEEFIEQKASRRSDVFAGPEVLALPEVQEELRKIEGVFVNIDTQRMMSFPGATDLGIFPNASYLYIEKHGDLSGSINPENVKHITVNIENTGVHSLGEYTDYTKYKNLQTFTIVSTRSSPFLVQFISALQKELPSVLVDYCCNINLARDTLKDASRLRSCAISITTNFERINDLVKRNPYLDTLILSRIPDAVDNTETDKIITLNKQIKRVILRPDDYFVSHLRLPYVRELKLMCNFEAPITRLDAYRDILASCSSLHTLSFFGRDVNGFVPFVVKLKTLKHLYITSDRINPEESNLIYDFLRDNEVETFSYFNFIHSAITMEEQEAENNVEFDPLNYGFQCVLPKDGTNGMRDSRVLHLKNLVLYVPQENNFSPVAVQYYDTMNSVQTVHGPGHLSGIYDYAYGGLMELLMKNNTIQRLYSLNYDVLMVMADPFDMHQGHYLYENGDVSIPENRIIQDLLLFNCWLDISPYLYRPELFRGRLCNGDVKYGAGIRSLIGFSDDDVDQYFYSMPLELRQTIIHELIVENKKAYIEEFIEKKDPMMVLKNRDLDTLNLQMTWNDHTLMDTRLSVEADNKRYSEVKLRTHNDMNTFVEKLREVQREIDVEDGWNGEDGDGDGDQDQGDQDQGNQDQGEQEDQEQGEQEDQEQGEQEDQEQEAPVPAPEVLTGRQRELSTFLEKLKKAWLETHSSLDGYLIDIPHNITDRQYSQIRKSREMNSQHKNYIGLMVRMEDELLDMEGVLDFSQYKYASNDQLLPYVNKPDYLAYVEEAKENVKGQRVRITDVMVVNVEREIEHRLSSADNIDLTNDSLNPDMTRYGEEKDELKRKYEVSLSELENMFIEQMANMKVISNIEFVLFNDLMKRIELMINRKYKVEMNALRVNVVDDILTEYVVGEIKIPDGSEKYDESWRIRLKWLMNKLEELTADDKKKIERDIIAGFDRRMLLTGSDETLSKSPDVSSLKIELLNLDLEVKYRIAKMIINKTPKYQ